ncbi:DNA cytosine methyltransferase [Conexibacter sp. JD483]|uniref:DNA cytosine methyltransferase n=1 Tax=unclassified Conexibacter TaxID=2627773 RepID=UPI002726C026|nr:MULTISPECIES: DNA cytosine methyltransferase [unclassified Conexibacter]MDO8189080.1 DNA cytosine methyltransferase [Conexibacter sp. CPCC 205706]MDO8201873.1 DNA cytosine methyltransferase [Conexibacter sp. CPCC 205762]MDR9372514.1 DNA cytosine methyltransferase [Conexibacter sp. JD483]
MGSHGYSAVSLYSGAGGLDLGFVRAGVEIAWAIDWDRDAVATHRELVDAPVVCRDLLEIALPAGPRPDLVIGSPPCEGFPLVAGQDRGDARSGHLLHFLDAVAQLEPRAFVLESVKALATGPRWRATRERLIAQARALGYAVELFVLDAAGHGVPQARERAFLVGLLDGRPAPPPCSAGPPPTVRETLLRLPRVGDPGNDGVCEARVVPARVPVLRPDAHRGSLLFDGAGRPLQLDGQARSIGASLGGSATPIVDQQELDDGADPWVVGYHARLLRGERPLKKAPSRMRRITTQEAAALQTFPLGTVFSGSLSSQYRQIGDAVPPRLAEAVAAGVVAALREADERAAAERELTHLGDPHATVA